jgi:hypothetical protein
MRHPDGKPLFLTSLFDGVEGSKLGLSWPSATEWLGW